MKKPVIAITVADKNNEKYAGMLERSFKHFHPDIPFKAITGADLEIYTKDDPHFFYRQKPIIGEQYLSEYDCVLGLDADQIVLGDLSYIWETKDYDVGCVLNFNQPDAERYGIIQGWGIHPVEYVNCGLVAMRSLKFVHNWKVWCYSNQFERLQYREQDGLNALVYHGNWNVRIFDHGDGPAKMAAFWGLFGKTYWPKAVLKDKKVIIPKNDTGIPKVDTELKVIHWGGGNIGNKLNYRVFFNEEVSDFIDTVIK